MVVHTLIPALRRQMQVDLCEFKPSLVYRVSSRTAGTRTTPRNPVSKNKMKQKNQSGQLLRKDTNVNIWLLHMCTGTHKINFKMQNMRPLRPIESLYDPNAYQSLQSTTVDNFFFLTWGEGAGLPWEGDKVTKEHLPNSSYASGRQWDWSSAPATSFLASTTPTLQPSKLRLQQ